MTTTPVERIIQAAEILVSHAKSLAHVRAKGLEAGKAERCYDEASAEWHAAIDAYRTTPAEIAQPATPEPAADAVSRFHAWAKPFLWSGDKAAMDLAFLAWSAATQPATPEPPAEEDTRPKVPAHIVGAIQLYGDARADAGDSGAALRVVLKDLRDWAAALAQASALQAAIPAQQPAEPLAWIEAEPAAKGVDLRTVAKGLLLSTCWHWQADRPTPMQPDNVLFPLYAPTAQSATSQQTKDVGDACRPGLSVAGAPAIPIARCPCGFPAPCVRSVPAAFCKKGLGTSQQTGASHE